MAVLIRDNGGKAKRKAEGDRFGEMEAYMKDIGRITRPMAMADSFMQMEMYI